ncbi:low molecular weight protein-tyrosine-phosphatase [Vogesella indigofera]|uniref:low molecular weight protein-tyrosine-phosphatase n=1 Tax=Vogesella indigofera TaxID=45465 RepID=UPI00234D6846|nr:low molecular weight protein-tyrosine-phosphatase [Vogesella indigofera]MDC7704566.1 low molecular weight phosphotyrosine protein phosphatase [Vogesella indigofera]
MTNKALPSARFRVLFVCTGNICRSPTAHAIFARDVGRAGLAAQIEVDSAGTSAWHAGEAADPRTVAAALRHGVDMSALRARPFRPQDWQQFDLILVAGYDHLAQLQRQMPADWPGELALMLADAEVPDPYYGGEAGFDAVFALLEQASRHWLDKARAQLPAI